MANIEVPPVARRASTLYVVYYKMTTVHAIRRAVIFCIPPILLFLISPLLASVFGGDGGPATPNMTFDSPSAPYTHERHTPVHTIKYFVRERDIRQYTERQLRELDRIAEQNALHQIRSGCKREQATQRRMREDAKGWFYHDEVKMALVDALETPLCRRLTQLDDRSMGKQNNWRKTGERIAMAQRLRTIHEAALHAENDP